MKKRLNEELSRINGMMKMISEEIFEDTMQPPHSVVNDAKKILRFFLNQENPQADETDVDSNGGWFTIDGGDNKYIKYYFDVNVRSHGHTRSGYGYMDNGDPGYPDEHEPMDFDIDVIQVELGETEHKDDQWVDNVEYKGPDFTKFTTLSFKDGRSGKEWLSNTFDDRILETDIEQEPTETINNNLNENKKMSKKITITESQLQRLMERKHSYTDNTPEGEMEEMIFPTEDHEGDELNTVEEIAKALKQSHDELTDLDYLMERLFAGIRKNNENLEGMDTKIGEAYQKVSQALSIVGEMLTDMGSDNDDEKQTYQIPGFENTLDDLDNALSIRESVESIKSNFKRFL